jgi:hypothetical protein
MKKDTKQLLFERMKKVNPDFIIKEELMSEISNNPNRLDATIRKKINRELSALPNYHEGIPINIIENILEKYGLLILQEDNTEYEGFFLGDESHTEITIGHINTAHQEDNITFYTPIENSMLILTWYKMGSGKYEIVSYLS